jgi:hypothetical protein
MAGPFKMKGSPAKLGTIQGTSGHASALKKEKRHTDYKDGSYTTLDSNMTARRYDSNDNLIGESSSGTPVTDLNQEARADMGLSSSGNAGELKENQYLGKEVNTAYDGSEIVPSKPKAAYGGDGRTWGEAQAEGEKSGFDLNQTTRDQRAYEKEMKAQNPDWNKREDNEWKRRQNSINKGLGSSKVYDVESDQVTDMEVNKRAEDKAIVDQGETKMAAEGPQQPGADGEKVYGAADEVTGDLNRNELRHQKKIGRQRVRDARQEHGRYSDEVKAAKAGRREEVRKTRQMVKTDRKDRRFVARDEALDRRIQRRKDRGRNTERLEKKKAANLQKEAEFGESLG